MKLSGIILPGLVLAVLTAVETRATEQSAEVRSTNLMTSEITHDWEPVFFWERLTSAFDNRSEDVFADRLQAFHMLKWNMQSKVNTDDFQDHTARAAQNGLSTSLSYGVRDTIVDSPLMTWLQERQGFLAVLLRDSIDSVEEESVAPLDGSYGLVEQSWWKSLRDNPAVHYGVRPFGTSPYVFSSFAVKDRDEIFFLGHVRYYYDKMADHRFEFALSVPLEHGFTIDAGTSYQFGQHADQRQAGIKLFKELKLGGIAHLGFEWRGAPTILAGITFHW